MSSQLICCWGQWNMVRGPAQGFQSLLPCHRLRAGQRQPAPHPCDAACFPYAVVLAAEYRGKKQGLDRELVGIKGPDQVENLAINTFGVLLKQADTREVARVTEHTAELVLDLLKEQPAEQRAARSVVSELLRPTDAREHAAGREFIAKQRQARKLSDTVDSCWDAKLQRIREHAAAKGVSVPRAKLAALSALKGQLKQALVACQHLPVSDRVAAVMQDGS